MYRMVYPFLPVIGRGLQVDLSTLSAALTLRSVTGCLGPGLAGLSDGLGRKTGMLAGLCLFSLGTILVWLHPGLLSFLLCLVLTIVGKYVYEPAIQAYLGDVIPYEKRGTVIAVSELGWSLSFIAGVPTAGYLIAGGNWTSPFLPLAALAAGAICLHALLIPREPVRRWRRPGMASHFRLVLAHKPARLALATGALGCCANEVVNLVFGVWMEDSFGLRIAALGAAAAVIGCSELAGELTAAGLTDRIGKRRAASLGFACSMAAALVLPWTGGTLAFALAGLFFFYITFEFTMVSLIPVVTELVPEARATLLALYVAALSFGRAAGAMLAPALYGNGIWACALASLVLNLFAWRLLQRFRLERV
jgi:DHA1 family inner membrane transport protein